MHDALKLYLLCVVVFAVELLLPKKAAGLRVQQGMTNAAAETVGVPGAGSHLEDVPVIDHVAAEAALTRLRLKKRRRRKWNGKKKKKKRG